MDYKKAVMRTISGFLAVVMAGSPFASVAYAAETYAEKTPAVQAEPAASPAASASPAPAETEPDAEDAPLILDVEDIPLVQDEDGDYLYTEEPTLVRNEAAAAAVAEQDNTEYLGDVEGANLSLYKVTPDADAIEIDTEPDPDEAAMYRAWFAAEAPSGDELSALLEQSDVWSAQVDSMAAMLELSRQEEDPDTGEIAPAKLATAETATGESALQEVDEELLAEAQVLFAPRQSSTIDFGSDEQSGSARAGAETSVYVIREDVIYVQVNDLLGNGINGASVYLSWNDESGKKQETTGVTATVTGAGGKSYDGLVEIPNMSGLRSGYISVAKAGYRIQTQLSCELNGGSRLTFVLTPTHDGDIYVRTADLDGVDLMNSSCDLSLVTSSTNAYDLTVIMAGTKASYDDFPTPTVRAVNAGDGVYDRQIDPTESFWLGLSDKNNVPGTLNQINVFRKKWSEQLEGRDTVLCSGDQLSLRYGDKILALNINVENAPCEASWLDGFSLNLIGGDGASFKISDSVPLVGGDSLSAECMDLKVTVIICPSGRLVLGYGASFKSYIDKEDFLGKAFSPSSDKKFEGITSTLKKAYAKRKDMLQQGKAFLGGASKGTHFVDGTAEVDLRAEFLATGSYDRSTGYLVADASGILTVSGQFGVTSYYFIPTPVYFGLEVVPSLTLDATIGLRFKPGNIRETFGFAPASRLELDIALAMTAYAGVGLRGVIGAEATGTIGLDIPIVAYAPAISPPPGHSYPHVSGTADFTVGLTAYLLFFRFRHVFLSTGVKLFDTWDNANLSLAANAPPQPERYRLDFEGTAENEAASAASSGEGDLLQTTLASDGTRYVAEQTIDAENFENGNIPIPSSTRLALIGGETKVGTDVFKSDNIVALTAVNGQGYLFRQATIKSSNGRSAPRVVYQAINSNSSLSRQSYTVPLPEDYDTVYSFSASVNHDDPNERANRNFVYIAMRIGHSGLDDLGARAADSRVCTVVINLANHSVYRGPYLHKRVTYGDFTYMGTPQVYGCNGNLVAACLTSTKYAAENPYSDGYEAFSDSGWRGSSAGETKNSNAKASIDNLTIASGSNPTLKGMTVNILYTTGADLLADSFSFQYGGFLNPVFKDRYPARISNLSYTNMGDAAAGSQQLSSLYLVSGNTLYMLDQNLRGSKMDCVTETGLDFSFSGGDSSMSYFHAKDSDNLQLVTVRQGADNATDDNGNIIRSTPISTVTVYNALKNSSGQYVMYGPQEYRIRGRNILHAAGFLDNEYLLKLFYTADEQSCILTEPSGLYGTSGYKDGTLQETCDLYCLDVGRDYKAEAVAIVSDKPFIQLSDSTLSLTVACKNQCSRPLNHIFLVVEDGHGNAIYKNGLTLFLQPGQTRQIQITPTIRSDWSGPTTLSAKILGAGWDQAQMSESSASVSYVFAVPSMHVNSTIVAHKSALATPPANERETDAVESHDQLTVNLELGNDSIVPVENTRIDVFRWNGYGEIMDGTEEDPEPVYTYTLGTLSETLMSGKDASINLSLPLENTWFEPTCDALEVRVSGDGVDPESTWVTNPSGGPMDIVATTPEDDFFGETSGDGMYFLGEEVTVTATAKPGYVFESWTNNGGDDLILSTDAAYTFTMECNLSLVAHFKEDGTAHKVVLETGTDADGDKMGAVELADRRQDSNFFEKTYRVEHGATVHLRALPHAGIEFVRWVNADTQEVVSTAAECNYTVNRAVTLSAEFRELSDSHYEPVRTTPGPSGNRDPEPDPDPQATPTPTPTPLPLGGSSPRTSDPSSAPLWLGLMVLGLAGTLFLRKKSKR